MTVSLHDLPGPIQANAALPAHAAATATENVTVFVAPFACKLRAVAVYFDAAATGDATNTTNLRVIDAGVAGSGTTIIGTLAYTTGVNVVAGTAQAVYTPAPGAYRPLAAGTVIQVQYEKVGTGLALGPGLAIITYEGN